MRKQFKLEEGEHLNRSPNKPIISLVGGSRTDIPYLWIGNNQKDDMCCFATLSGRRALRSLAKHILKVVGNDS